MMNLSDILNELLLEAKCWDGYRKSGTKIKNGRVVNNCIRKKGFVYEAEKTKSGKKVNPAYLTKNKAAMKREIDRVSKLKSDDPSAYGKWEADYADKGKTKKYKTKKSKATTAYEKRFGKKK